MAPNLLQRDFSTDQPNSKWVADTTYIWAAEGWLYLAVVLDLFSRMAAIHDATLVTQALRMAVARRRPPAGLLHHTDRGSTCTSESYQALLRREGMVVSMSRTADCYDNAAIESFFHTFKGEYIDSQSFQTRAQARSVTFDYIETFYNRTRRHPLSTSLLSVCARTIDVLIPRFGIPTNSGEDQVVSTARKLRMIHESGATPNHHMCQGLYFQRRFTSSAKRSYSRIGKISSNSS